MVGRDPNPAFRLLRVPGFEREHMPRLMQFALLHTLAAKNSWVSACLRPEVHEPPQTVDHCRGAQPLEK